MRSHVRLTEWCCHVSVKLCSFSDDSDGKTGNGHKLSARKRLKIRKAALKRKKLAKKARRKQGTVSCAQKLS